MHFFQVSCGRGLPERHNDFIFVIMACFLVIVTGFYGDVPQGVGMYGFDLVFSFFRIRNQTQVFVLMFLHPTQYPRVHYRDNPFPRFSGRLGKDEIFGIPAWEGGRFVSPAFLQRFTGEAQISVDLR
ncbi:hypothetical protein D1872_273500 [compost metagenome]